MGSAGSPDKWEDYLKDPASGFAAEWIESQPHMVTLVPLVRGLIRIRRVALRVHAACCRRPVRGLGSALLGLYNHRYVRLLSLETARRIGGIIEEVLALECGGGVDIQSGEEEVVVVWRLASELLGELEPSMAPSSAAGDGERAHGRSSRVGPLRICVDVDDVFGRLAEFYSLRKKGAASSTLGVMVEEYYAGSDVEGIVDSEEPPEGPLRDLLLDASGVIACLARGPEAEITVVDYGFGLGRTRAWFNEMMRAVGGKELWLRVSYVGVDVAYPPVRRAVLRRNNGPCNRCSGSDSLDEWLVLIDATEPGSVIETYCGCGTKHAVCERELPKADILILVNVLHEVPLEAMPTLLCNVARSVGRGGVVLLYEMLSLKEVEHHYSLWHPEDLRAVFGGCGFAVVAASGRISRSGRSGGWGYPYVSACIVRTAADVLDLDAAKVAAWSGWNHRTMSAIARLQVLSDKLASRTAHDADRFEHFHAVNGLANLLQQTPHCKQSRQES